MPDLKAFEKKIFSISSSDSFNELAIDIFHFQYKNNKVYRNFVDYIGIKPSAVNHYLKIPFLPIEFFKDQRIVSDQMVKKTLVIADHASRRYHDCTQLSTQIL